MVNADRMGQNIGIIDIIRIIWISVLRVEEDLICSTVEECWRGPGRD